jgi:O-methyltransferase involved in polyketide biosynthesis
MKIELTGVPETSLWNLYHRAAEARRSDSILMDPGEYKEIASISPAIAGVRSPPCRAAAASSRWCPTRIAFRSSGGCACRSCRRAFAGRDERAGRNGRANRAGLSAPG